MGALQGWGFRHSVSPDGVAYLDLSDSIVRGQVGGIVNGYWSPFYPTLVGLIRIAVSPTALGQPYWEFALLHVVSFVGFVLALAAFEWFLRSLHATSIVWNALKPVSPAGLAVAYLLFGIASLGMVSVAATVPDFFLFAAMLAAFACVLRLREDPTDRAAALRLGVALAVGALTKSIGFWIAAVVIVVLAISTWPRGGRTAVFRSAGVFVLVSLPWVVALSVAQGRPSIGQTGALNYAWYVNDQQPPNTGSLPKLAIPRQPLPVRIGVMPEARGTDPLWYDPARWHADVRPRFSASQQWTRLAWSLRYYVYFAAPLLLAALAIGASASRSQLTMALKRASPVLLPSLVALGAYGLVYTTSRHIAVFLLTTCLVLAAAFPRDAILSAGRFGAGFGAALFAIERLAPASLRSMVVVSYGLALFMIAWVWLANSPGGRRVALATLAVLFVWVLPLVPAALAPVLPVAFGVALWLGVSRAQRAHDATFDLHLRRSFAIAAVVAMAIPYLAFGGVAVGGWMSGPRSPVHPEWAAAQRLIGDGVPVSARIALLGSPGSTGWARIARYQIVAIVPDSQVQAFTRLNDADRARVMSAFSQAGAMRLVARPTP